MKSEPMIQEVDGGRLVAECLTIQGAAKVVGDETVASLTIKTHQTMNTITVGGLLDHKTKIH
jgi:hypothetical protein